jgi:aspartyl-tRNA(Asn)/glutamyl-tRNA(Gln) amidotransferase subunit B
MFCACPNVAGGTPNAATCPVCCGLPGAMPTLNRRAVELGLRAALLFDADVADVIAFDRKHYAYPDLPKGYQTTQHRQPLARGGALELAAARRIPLTRLHLEDDAGRSRHDARSTHVDLSRAGAPLIEIVTEPELLSGADVRDFLARLREDLRFAGVSDCDMEKGSLRCDVNVSVARRGTPGFARVELKNLNSIRAAGEAVAAEFARQERLLEALTSGHGPGPTDETRGWHAEGRRSFAMRTKEHATDYRFLPEPDLPAVCIEAADVARIQSELPEGPAAVRARWRETRGLSAALAAELTTRPARAAYFESCLAAGAPAKLAAKWITNELAAAARKSRGSDGTTESPPLAPETLAELLRLLDTQKLSRAGAERVFAALLERKHTPEAVARELGLLITPASEPHDLGAEARTALELRPDAAEAVRAGNPKALDALVGVVMRSGAGHLDGRAVRAALLAELGARGD